MKEKNRKGQVMVEAAIGLPIFLMLVLGSLEIIKFAMRKVQTNYAVFTANRVAVVNKGDTSAVRKALERISGKLEGTKIQLVTVGDGEEYALTLENDYETMVPWFDMDSIKIKAYARIPIGSYENNKRYNEYRYTGYNTYYPQIWQSPDKDDAGILEYDRNLRGFVRQEGLFFERYPLGGDGEAEVVRAGEDREPFHLGSWYPPKGIMRNPGPEKDRTGWHALLDQYLYISTPIPYPYRSRAWVEFGHGDNVKHREYAWTYYPIPPFGWWFGYNSFAEAIFPYPSYFPYMVGHMKPTSWGTIWDLWASNGNPGTWITGAGFVSPCFYIPTPWGEIPMGVKGPTVYTGVEYHYIGERDWDWDGTRRLYDAAYALTQPLEMFFTFTTGTSHGHNTPWKDDMRGFGGKWSCLFPSGHWDNETAYGLPPFFVTPWGSHSHHEDR